MRYDVNIHVTGVYIKPAGRK